MAAKVVCKKCNVENPLGRVFCGACGVRLDMTNLKQPEGLAAHLPAINLRTLVRWLNMLVAPLLSASVVVALLMLWPKTPQVPAGLTLTQDQAVNAQLRVIEDLRLGRSVTVEVSEADINAYFFHRRTKELGIQAVHVEIGDGYLLLHLLRRLPSMTIGNWTPALSYDVLCLPAGNRLAVRKVTVGHMPLGPFRGRVERTLRRLFVNGREHKLLTDVTKIEAVTGKLRVTAKK